MSISECSSECKACSGTGYLTIPILDYNQAFAILNADDVDRLAAKAAFATAHRVLNRLNVQITHLTSALSRFKIHRDIVQQLLASKDNILSPIQSLPFEVLTRIFYLYVHSKDAVVSRSTRRNSAWVLSHVSQSWRSAAHGVPALWAIHDGSVDGFPWVDPLSGRKTHNALGQRKLFSQELQRVGTSYLYSVPFHILSLNSDLTRDTLLSLSRQWKSVHLPTDFLYDPRICSTLKGRLPNLEAIYLRPRRKAFMHRLMYPNSAPDCSVLSAEMVPSLHRLHIRGSISPTASRPQSPMLPVVLSLPLSQITSLSLCAGIWRKDIIASFLASLTSLATLTFDHFTTTGPDLEDVPTVCIPMLHTLQILGSGFPGHLLFNVVKMPSLKHLTWKRPNSVHSNFILSTDIVKRSKCQLETLKGIIIDPTADDSNIEFSLFPSLITLELAIQPAIKVTPLFTEVVECFVYGQGHTFMPFLTNLEMCIPWAALSKLGRSIYHIAASRYLSGDAVSIRSLKLHFVNPPAILQCDRISDTELTLFQDRFGWLVQEGLELEIKIYDSHE